MAKRGDKALQQTPHALRVPLVQLFFGYEKERGCMHLRAGEGVKIEGRSCSSI